jgi:hypothetical protein
MDMLMSNCAFLRYLFGSPAIHGGIVSRDAVMDPWLCVTGLLRFCLYRSQTVFKCFYKKFSLTSL